MELSIPEPAGDLFYCHLNLVTGLKVLQSNVTVRRFLQAHENGEPGGLPLGVSEESPYQKDEKKIKYDQIILIGTDGIWESQNPSGEMFGKDRFRNIVREHSGKSAKQILSAVMVAIDNFSQAHQKADDVTLVVVKVV